jgi:hypothetical protein
LLSAELPWDIAMSLCSRSTLTTATAVSVSGAAKVSTEDNDRWVTSVWIISFKDKVSGSR